MDLIDGLIVYYLDVKSAMSLRVCNSKQFCVHKVKVYIIEKWWRDILLKGWVRKVYDCSGLPYKKQQLQCKFCSKRRICDAVLLNRKLMFSCFSCYAGLEADVIHEIYPQIFTPLHTAYVLFVRQNDVNFERMHVEHSEEYENCRTQ